MRDIYVQSLLFAMLFLALMGALTVGIARLVARMLAGAAVTGLLIRIFQLRKSDREPSLFDMDWRFPFLMLGLGWILYLLNYWCGW